MCVLFLDTFSWLLLSRIVPNFIKTFVIQKFVIRFSLNSFVLKYIHYKTWLLSVKLIKVFQQCEIGAWNQTFSYQFQQLLACWFIMQLFCFRLTPCCAFQLLEQYAKRFNAFRTLFRAMLISNCNKAIQCHAFTYVAFIF